MEEEHGHDDRVVKIVFCPVLIGSQPDNLGYQPPTCGFGSPHQTSSALWLHNHDLHNAQP